MTFAEGSFWLGQEDRDRARRKCKSEKRFANKYVKDWHATCKILKAWNAIEPGFQVKTLVLVGCRPDVKRIFGTQIPNMCDV